MTGKILEKDIETLILTWLNYQPGCFAFKMNIKGIWDQRGFYRKSGKFVPVGGSDIVFLLSGLFGVFEVKTPAAHKKFVSSPGEHELRQISFIQQVQAKGGFGAVVSSLEQVQSHIKKLSIKISLLEATAALPRTPLTLT